MKFQYENFSCDVETFEREQDIMIRFYDAAKEPDKNRISDLVIVDPGYGYLCLKFKGDAALLGGYLNEAFFKSDDAMEAVVAFIENLYPQTQNVYMPYHIDRVRKTGDVEYNGEY
ncbi:hypothetical protein [Saccharibacillus sacchari]|uniref:Uncharacterized protein n=1 Tax=Saccharibacillus sacchari TaxID=456493 RepID=A0ACC6P7C3_9BACL